MCHQARKKCCSLQQRVAAIFSSAQAFFFCACQYIWINNSQRYATPNLNKISTEISTRRQSGAVRYMWPHAALDIVVRQTYICIYFSYMPWQVTSEAPLCSMSAPIRLAQPHEEGTHQTGALAETRVGSQKKLSHEYAGLFSAGSRQPNKLIMIKANK